MKEKMKTNSAILVLIGVVFLLSNTFAQNAGQTELPSAPSAARTQSQPKPAPPAPAQETAQNAAPSAQASAGSTSQTAAPPAAQTPQAVPPAPNPSQNAPQNTGASAPVAPEDEPITTIISVVNEVNVVFTVTDKHGHYVKDLTKNDFRVIDDNKPAVQIRSFLNEANLPLQVGLLVDASNSIRDRFRFEQEAAIEFLNQVVRPKFDKAFVVGFDVTPEVTQDFTDNTEALSRGVRALRPGGGTAMYDALYFACRDKLLKQQRTGPARRAIILLSDGDDNQSHVTREEAIEMAQRAEVTVYAISTNVAQAGDASEGKGVRQHTNSGEKGDKVLERIADATGGRAFFPFQVNDVANAFSEIQDELRSQYALSYKPADFKLDGRYRSIEILAQNKNLRVRSRHGYFAPK